jgi:hypothetical protein
MQRQLVFAALFCAIALIQGCATPSAGVNMVASPEGSTTGPRDPSLQRAIKLRNVAGGSETNALWMSKVSDADFRFALENSLKSAGLLSTGEAPRYQLDATLLSLEQPLVGFSLTVTCSVRYDLSDAASAKRVFGKTITTPFTATTSDAFLGVERMRIANEGAVRQNLRQLLQELLVLDVTKTASQ